MRFFVGMWAALSMAACGVNEVTVRIEGGDGNKVRLDAAGLEHKFNRLVDAGTFSFAEVREGEYAINAAATGMVAARTLNVESEPFFGKKKYELSIAIPGGGNGPYEPQGTIAYASTPDRGSGLGPVHHPRQRRGTDSAHPHPRVRAAPGLVSRRRRDRLHPRRDDGKHRHLGDGGRRQRRAAPDRAPRARRAPGLVSRRRHHRLPKPARGGPGGLADGQRRRRQQAQAGQGKGAGVVSGRANVSHSLPGTSTTTTRSTSSTSTARTCDG